MVVVALVLVRFTLIEAFVVGGGGAGVCWRFRRGYFSTRVVFALAFGLMVERTLSDMPAHIGFS